jgi:hypothetical protein
MLARYALRLSATIKALRPLRCVSTNQWLELLKAHVN